MSCILVAQLINSLILPYAVSDYSLLMGGDMLEY
jgi:hypothetical protein